MARSLERSSIGSNKDEANPADEWEANKKRCKIKKANSWDGSSSSTKERLTPKCKQSDWDSSSDCHETVLEPFDDEAKELLTLNSDIDDQSSLKVESLNNISKRKQTESKSSTESIENLLLDVKEEEKCILFDLRSVHSEKAFKNESLRGRKFKCGTQREKEENSLLLEDLEEFLKDSGRQSLKFKNSLFGESDKEKENESNPTEEGTADSTIWMIPKSERSFSSPTNSRQLTVSERRKIENLDSGKATTKKTKSSLNVKRREKTVKSTRSECSNNVKCKKINKSDLMIKCDEPPSKTKLNDKFDEKQKNFDDMEVYFAEYECRAMTMDSEPEKMEKQTILCDRTQIEDDEVTNSDSKSPSENEEKEHLPNEGNNNYNTVRAGTSTQPNMEVVSLPDIFGRTVIKNRSVKEKKKKNCPELRANNQSSPKTIPVNESWYLLDETGRYQEVTRDEVSILLNGRSTDAVLLGHKEHVIPSSTLKSTNSQNGSLSGVLTKESIQNILKQEDLGGEGHSPKTIDLERKVENTLLFIQPGINLTASIRIIPVDTEMIHLWRRSRDNGSLLSSELDLRLQPSQDSVENNNARTLNDIHSTNPLRYYLEISREPVVEQDENSIIDTQNNIKIPPVVEKRDNITPDYSRLLLETRTIVDTLTNNVKLLQSRLDGETTRSLLLQNEVTKLRQLLKEPKEKFTTEIDSREALSGTHQSEESSYSSIVKLTQPERTSFKNNKGFEESVEGNDKLNEIVLYEGSPLSKVLFADTKEKSNQTSGGCITVNIYTHEEKALGENLKYLTVERPLGNETSVQETNSILQANLEIIEGKMKRLEHENEVISQQNEQLKKKLKEISQELEKYLVSTTDTDDCGDDDTDTLRDQVCNLKLELDNLKKSAEEKEKKIKQENALIMEQLEESFLVLEKWKTASHQILRTIENSKIKLCDSGILSEDICSWEENTQEPKNLMNILNSFLQSLTEKLIFVQNENLLYDKSKKNEENIPHKDDEKKETIGLDKVISGYSDLIDQCRQSTTKESKEKVMEDYFRVIMEKATLSQEIKVLKTENEMLMQSQMEHYEKLKQTMIALKERKNEILALQSTQKLSDEEKIQMSDILKLYEEQKITMEKDIMEKKKTIDSLFEEKKKSDLEMAEKVENLEKITEQVNNLEKLCLSKDDLINQFQVENKQLLEVEKDRNSQIEALKKELSSLKTHKAQLESEMNSIKQFMNQSQNEMTEYINHLETIVNNYQDNIEKNKQKLKDSNQTVSRLKTENEALDKQYQCEIKLYNKTKEELTLCQEKLINMTTRCKQAEDEREKFSEKFIILRNAEKRLSDSLELTTKECKILEDENIEIKRKMNMYSKDRDESLKEQKDLINKYALVSKELQKMQDKYRHVKAECNDRTNIIKCLEIMLKENMAEYNNKITYLENSITHILNKIAACQYSMKEQYTSPDSEVQELKQQLSITCQQRKELENMVNNYYSLMKNMESEMQEKDKEVDELQIKLSNEHRKCTKIVCESNSSLGNENNKKDIDILKIEELENEILKAESELSDFKEKMKQNDFNHENEKKKLELIIVDLKSEISRYQMRMEVMMKNLPNTKNSKDDDRETSSEEFVKKLNITNNDILAKERKIVELSELLDKMVSDMKVKDNEVESLKKKNFCMNEMLKSLQCQALKMENALRTNKKNNEKQEKEKNEITEKLLQSIRIIMEEKTAKQSIEAMAMEKEKSFREQLDLAKNEVSLKTESMKCLSEEIHEKEKLIIKLQQDLKKSKLIIYSLKTQVSEYQEMNLILKGNENINSRCIWNQEILQKSNSLTQIKFNKFSPERFESCIKELKELREINLCLRKTEGEYQAKIVRLEDEIRDARLLIKKLEGGIKMEKKSKKAIKNKIISAKMEIENLLNQKQITSTSAHRITRYFDFKDTSSKNFRLARSSNSSESENC